MPATGATNTYAVSITTTHDLGNVSLSARPYHVLARLGEFLEGFAAGAKFGTVDVQANGGSSGKASGTVTISSGSGTVTATINGVGIPITWATSDTNSATLLKNAINASANALVSGVVTATSALGVVTITAANAGTSGNWVTLAASGTGATASGARLTAGAANSNALTY